MPCNRRSWIAWGLGAILAPQSAHGLTFRFNPAEGTSQEAIEAFVEAGRRWSANFTDNIIVSIDINFSDLGAEILGDTHLAMVEKSYSDIRNRLRYDRRSADDTSAFNALPTSSSLGMLINRTANHPEGAGSSTPYLDDDGGPNNTTLLLSHANAKALGFWTPTKQADARISFNSKFSWDFDPKDGIGRGAFDFVGIATHEIGHALGFFSGVDELDYRQSPGNDDELALVNTLDLFRFSAESVAEGKEIIDFSADSRVKYFSIDGGATQLGRLASGVLHGDGRQASHWKDGANQGLMGPTVAPGTAMTISTLDRRAFDVIGYNLNTTFKWDQAADGTWSNALSWSAACVPDGAITATFGVGGSYTVHINKPAAASRVFVNSGGVTLNLAEQNLTVSRSVGVGLEAGSGAGLVVQGSGTLGCNELHIGGTGDDPGGSGVVRVAGGRVNVGSTVRIWDTPGSALTIDGGTLSADVIVNEGVFELVDGGLRIGTSFIQNKGRARFAAGQQWAAGARLEVRSGSVVMATDAGSTDGGTLNVVVNSTGQLRFESNQHLKELTIVGGRVEFAANQRHSLVLSDLHMDAQGVLNLAEGDLIFQGTRENRDSAFSQISQLIQNSRNNALTRWAGSGITSSAAQENSLSGLAILLNNRGDGVPILTNFSGEIVDENCILVMHTWNGDVNLDGLIDAADYFLIDSGFITQESGYRHGDLNLDGVVDAGDYFLVDSAFIGQDGRFRTESVAFSTVPEPALSGVLLGVMLLAVRPLYGRQRYQSHIKGRLTSIQ